VAPVLVASDGFAGIRVGWNFERLAGAQVALFVACPSDPGERATSTVGTTVVEETGEGGNVSIAIGTEALIEGARSDASKAQQRNLMSRRVVVGADVDAIPVADEDEGRHCNNNREG
jgi:hypothetical protein